MYGFVQEWAVGTLPIVEQIKLYRDRAANMLTLANGCSNDTQKLVYLFMAQGYDEMAARAQSRFN